MVNSKLRNDATGPIDGIVYQFYVALKYAFDLPENRKLFIEKFGDVTLESMHQIEVKKYQDSLTDSHENLWNTLLNWLDEHFNVDNFETLILLTTQSIGERSVLKDWSLKSSKQKLVILDGINAKYSNRKKKDESKEKLIKNVLKIENRKKLELILEKFIIVSSNPDDVKLYNQLCMRYARNIPKNNRDNYIKALLGYVISPKGVKGDKWEITCDDFNSECEKLAKLLIDEKSMFPRNEYYRQVDCKDYKGYLFVKKIEEIEHYEEIQEAVKEYAEIHSLVINELLTRQTSKKKYNEYEENIKTDYRRLYRIANRSICSENRMEASKNFYDNIMVMEVSQFMTYTDTPKIFRNGILHMLADDTNENIKWKLGDNNG